MNINYSQFYRGATTIPTSGGGTVGPRQLVKYEFNTRDEQGNKVMDKMSREETLAAMKEIRSQYGDDVMIEFSGDGMAALVEGGKNGDLDGIVKPDEAKQAAFQGTIIQMENAHVVKTTEDAPGRMDILKEKAPDLYNEIQELNHNIINHKNGEKYGHRFLELHKRAEKVLNAAAEEESKVEQTGETQLSQKAQKLLEKLRKKYGNIDFMVGDYDNAEDAKKLLSGGTKETTVLFSVEELEKMAKGASNDMGTGGMATKIGAAKIATASGADMVIANGRNIYTINDIMAGKKIGTLFLSREHGIELKNELAPERAQYRRQAKKQKKENQKEDETKSMYHMEQETMGVSMNLIGGSYGQLYGNIG